MRRGFRVPTEQMLHSTTKNSHSTTQVGHVYGLPTIQDLRRSQQSLETPSLLLPTMCLSRHKVSKYIQLTETSQEAIHCTNCLL